MREIRLSGSEGGAVYPVPTPIGEPGFSASALLADDERIIESDER